MGRPPADLDDYLDWQEVPDGEFLEAQFRETQAEASRELQLVLDPEFL